MELPSHPEAHDSGTERGPTATGNRAAAVVLAVVVGIVAVVVILHFAGVVGPGS